MAVDKCNLGDHDLRHGSRPGWWFCAVCGWRLILGEWQPPRGDLVSACPVCACPRREAVAGECRVPIPTPQPFGCLMVELERAEEAS